MEYYDKEFCLEVWGPMACFTRPELKVERVSHKSKSYARKAVCT